MKALLLAPILGLILCATSCQVRTFTPIDPMTMQPSTRCLPEHVSTIHATK